MPDFVTKLADVAGLQEYERRELEGVASKYEFQSNEYYLSLIDWNDPDDPIRRIIIPSIDELDEWGMEDPSNEKKFTQLQGLEHKYTSTVLLLLSNKCGGVCRFCFRKRVFKEGHDETLHDVDAAMDYISAHKEVRNVLLTGGDSLMLGTPYIDYVLMRLREIDHVHIIRMGSKLPAFYPFRISGDQALLDMFKRYSKPDKRIYVMIHFNHPREITDAAIEAVDALLSAGVIVCNQTPLIRGVNDDPDVLAELLMKLSYIGAAPYYVFQCRPTIANRPYTVPIEEGYRIVEQAKTQVSGLAKRLKFAMSHATGKIEIVGLSDNHVYFKYHRAADDKDSGRFLTFERNPDALWLDDYVQSVVEDISLTGSDLAWQGMWS